MISFWVDVLVRRRVTAVHGGARGPRDGGCGGGGGENPVGSGALLASLLK